MYRFFPAFLLLFTVVLSGNILLENTGFACTKQSECTSLLGDGWCKYSTVLCYAGQCRVSPLRACSPYENGNASSPCLKRNHRCEVKPCSNNSDCVDEDGNRQFCDGYDRCTNGQCQFYYLTNNCARQNTKCIKRENICTQPIQSTITGSPTTSATVVTNTIPGNIIIQVTNSSNSTNSTNSTVAPTVEPPPPVNFWLWWIVLLSIFGFVTLFVVIVATLTRNAPPTFVPNNNRNGVAYYY